MFKNILSLIFLAAAIIVFFTWTKPYLDSLKPLRAEEQRLNKILDDIKELQAAREGLLSTYNSIDQKNFERLNKFLPSYADAMDVILEIENITKSNNLLMKNINVGQVSGTPISDNMKSLGPDKVPINITVSGSYNSFLSFLEALAKSLRLVDIEGVSFSSADIDLYEYSITAETYWKR